MNLCPICKKNPWVKCWRFCVGRVLVAILIAFLCSTATAGKPSLLFFTDPGRCAPCRQFDADWRRDKMFRQAVETAFAIVPSYQPGTHPEQFKKYAIASVPTWVIVLPDGSERGRVAGYTTPQDLWTRLQNATKNTPPTAGSVPDPDAGVLQRLQDANRALEAECDALRAEIRQLERRIAQTPQTGDQASLIASLKAEIKRFEVQIQRLNAEASKRITSAEKVAQNATAEAERLRKQCELPPAPEYHDEPIAETPAKFETAEKSSRGFLGSILFHGSRFAMDLGLSQVQSEIFAPIAIAAGPIGIAAAAGFAFLRFRQRRARGDPPPRPQQATPAGGVTVERTFVVDSPPLPQRERIDTQFVNVESDKYRKAHEQARQQIARKYPGSQEILEAELSLTRQFYAGQA